MAWNRDKWNQNDDIFYGYPYLTEPLPIINNELPTVWIVENDYPYVENSHLELNLHDLNMSWQFNPEVNEGYPYIEELLLFPPYPILMIGDKEIVNAYIGENLVYSAGGIKTIQQENFLSEEND